MHALLYPFVPTGLLLDERFYSPTADAEPVSSHTSYQALALFRGRDSGPSRSVAAFLRNLSEGHHFQIRSDKTMAECRLSPRFCLACFRDVQSCRGRFGRWLGRINP